MYTARALPGKVNTLYKEVHVDKDGSYIKGSQSVGQNMSALDTGLKTTSDLIHTNDKGDTIQIGGNSPATKVDISGKDAKGNKTGRVITGVVSDANPCQARFEQGMSSNHPIERERDVHMARKTAVWTQRMKELRRANNLSQSDVAKVLHCTQVAYGMYELGKRRISVENLVKLARYYRVSLDYLTGMRDWV